MQETLYIENFGPIKKATLDLRQAMVFIGPQSSGKSTIAKLVTIMRDFRFVTSQNTFESLLEDFNIKIYDNPLAKIEYKSNNYSFVYIDGKGSLTHTIDNKWQKLEKDFADFEKTNPRPSLKEHEEQIKKRREEVTEFQKKIDEESNLEKQIEMLKLAVKMLKEISAEDEIYQKRVKNVHDYVTAVISYSNYSRYIPAERLLISLYSGSTLSFLNNNLPIPKSIIEFGDYFQKARSETKQLIIPFLLYKFIHKDGEDFIVTDNFELNLKDMSSGIQALVPLIIVIDYLSNHDEFTYSYIIEEPEQNLYPKTQKDLIYYLASKCLQYNDRTSRGNDLIITTHSPYTLSSFNNLLFAYQVAHKTKDKIEVSKIIKEEEWINPYEFNAYFVADGMVNQIFNRDTGLIDENELDSASEDIMGDFEQLMDIYKGIKA